jgi:hypothetical protein
MRQSKIKGAGSFRLFEPVPFCCFCIKYIIFFRLSHPFRRGLCHRMVLCRRHGFHLQDRLGCRLWLPVFCSFRRPLVALAYFWVLLVWELPVLVAPVCVVEVLHVSVVSGALAERDDGISVRKYGRTDPVCRSVLLHGLC